MLPSPTSVAVTVATLFQILPLAAASVSETPWELPADHLRDNGRRGDVILNGWWEGQPASGGTPEPTLVPGTEKDRKDHQFRREIPLPDGWADRQLALEISRLAENGSVTVNGRTLVEPGDEEFRGRFVELPIPPDLIRKDGTQELVIATDSIADDVWLRAYPATDTRITDSYFTTSFRKQEADIALEGEAPPGAVVRPIVKVFTDPTDKTPIKTFPGEPVTADADGRWSTHITAPWTDATLWSPDTPHLYHYTVELFDAADQLTDAVLPRSFGFREVWLEPKGFVMNGVPLHFSGDTWSRSMGQDLQFREQAEATMRIFRAAGLRGVARLSSDVAFETADRVGVLIAQGPVGALDVPVEIAPALRKDEAGDAGGDADFVGGDAEKYERSKRRIIRSVKRWREHPSILTWSFRSPWSRVTLDTTQVGRSEDPWKYWPGNADEEKTENNRLRYEVASATAAYIARLDPVRPLAAQNQPDVQVEFATRYLCDNLDLQEREMFFDDWLASDSAKVLMPSEAGMPFPGHQFLRKKDHQMPQGHAYPAIHLENAARLFGDEVFAQEPPERFPQWHRGRDGFHKESPVYQRLTAENVGQIWPAWRTAGVNTLAHWVLREGFAPGEDRLPATRLDIPAEVDPRRPGLARAGGPISDDAFPFPGIDRELAGGTAYLGGVKPVIAYLAGAPSGSPANKDHLYLAGAPIEKSVVVLNDTFSPIPLTGQWSLRDARGTEVAAAPLETTIKPGERATTKLPISLTAPDVTKRTDFTLALRLDRPDSEPLEDTFALTVFPSPEPAAQPKRKVWTLGDGDLTARTGLTATPLTVDPGSPAPAPGDLLIVQRNAFGSESDDPLAAPAAQAWKTHNLDQLIDQGLNVVILEQDVPNLLGLATETVRPRRVFATNLDHPVFEGLAPSDLTHWTGASDLQVAVPDTNTPELKKFPTRLWQVSNENSVATRTLIRPQVGAARALAVSGFGLQETPLLEVARGRGRILFCQLDVSNRYGTDPVATRLVNQLIHYADQAPPPDPSRSEVARVTTDVTQRPATYLAAKPTGPAATGITQADLFFRESIYAGNEITRTRPEGIVPVFADSAAADHPEVIRQLADGRFGFTLDESDFKTGWAKLKVAAIRNALIVTQGGSTPNGPALAHHGQPDSLYPHKWLEGFINPYTAACW